MYQSALDEAQEMIAALASAHPIEKEGFFHYDIAKPDSLSLIQGAPPSLHILQKALRQSGERELKIYAEQNPMTFVLRQPFAHHAVQESLRQFKSALEADLQPDAEGLYRLTAGLGDQPKALLSPRYLTDNLNSAEMLYRVQKNALTQEEMDARLADIEEELETLYTALEAHPDYIEPDALDEYLSGMPEAESSEYGPEADTEVGDIDALTDHIDLLEVEASELNGRPPLVGIRLSAEDLEKAAETIGFHNPLSTTLKR